MWPEPTFFWLCENPVNSQNFAWLQLAKVILKSYGSDAIVENRSRAEVDRFAHDSCMTLHDLCITNVKFPFLLSVTRYNIYKHDFRKFVVQAAMQDTVNSSSGRGNCWQTMGSSSLRTSTSSLATYHTPPYQIFPTSAIYHHPPSFSSLSDIVSYQFRVHVFMNSSLPTSTDSCSTRPGPESHGFWYGI